MVSWRHGDGCLTAARRPPAPSSINFWPTQNLDRYLDLKNRVEARMVLADAAATGLDDPLADEPAAGEAAGAKGAAGKGGAAGAGREAAVQGELAFRDEQLLRLRDEILDIEQAGDGVALSDLTLDDFVADLLRYVQRNREELEAAPAGIHAVVAAEPDGPARQGVLFCLKQRTEPAERTPNLLQPYYLVHVRGDGAMRHSFRQAAQCMTLFRELAAERTQPSAALEAAFDRETGQGQRMAKYEYLLAAALRDIAAQFGGAQRRSLTQGRGARLTGRSQRPRVAGGFELITWLVIADPAPAAGANADADG